MRQERRRIGSAFCRQEKSLASTRGVAVPSHAAHPVKLVNNGDGGIEHRARKQEEARLQFLYRCRRKPGSIETPGKGRGKTNDKTSKDNGNGEGPP